jgi:hypothetical protein
VRATKRDDVKSWRVTAKRDDAEPDAAGVQKGCLKNLLQCHRDHPKDSQQALNFCMLHDA